VNLIQKLRDRAVELGERVVIRVSGAKPVEEAIWNPPPPPNAEQALRAKLVELETVLSALEAQTSFYKRRSEEYFKLIHGMELEREQWKKMYLDNAGAHQQAQAILEHALEGARHAIRKCIDVVNIYRERAGEPKATDVVDVKAPPIGIADATKQRDAAVEAAVPPQIDAKVEQERIDAALGPAPEGLKTAG
jgi:hypothetical protein